MTQTMGTRNPFQLPRLAEIQAGKKFWGYLDTEALRTRYVLAAHFLRHAKNIIEIGGYRDNVITNFLYGQHDSVTVYSLDAEFEPFERDTLNGAPCRVRHIADFFQAHSHPETQMGLLVLGLEIIGDIEPFLALLRRAQIAVLEVPEGHKPSEEQMEMIFHQVEARIACQVNLDLSPNAALLKEEIERSNMNVPFWKRILYVLEPR